MADTVLQFELVSPEKLIFSKPVAMVTVPGGEGEYGVLPGHVPMITTVNPGVIQVFGSSASKVSERIFVAGGFAEVTQTRCTVLATEATPVGDLNRAVLEEQAKQLTASLAAAKSDFERDAIQAQQNVVAAKIQAAA
jgi:F-type H+-transporting ATPase subunit epsilon